jgi:hypothetical protein
MMNYKRRSQVLKAGAFTLAALGLAMTITFISAPVSTADAQPAAAGPDAAVRRALTIAQRGLPGGLGTRLAGDPTEIRGQLMTYGEFYRLIEGRAIAADEGIWPFRDRQVWIVAFRGDILPGDQRWTYRQMVLALDAATGQLIEAHSYPTGSELSTASLPIRTRPTNTTPLPAPTIAPGPPATPAAPGPLNAPPTAQ